MDNSLPDIDPTLYGLNLHVHRSIETGADVVLLVDGLIVTGRLTSAYSVLRDALLDMRFGEEFANAFAARSGEQEASKLLNLIDVIVRGENANYSLPFLRVRMSAVDAWSLGPLTDTASTTPGHEENALS